MLVRLSILGASSARDGVVYPGMSCGLSSQWWPALTEGRLGRDCESRRRPPGPQLQT
jgi:hypothetical protein